MQNKAYFTRNIIRYYKTEVLNKTKELVWII